MFAIIFCFIVIYARSLNYISAAINMFNENKKRQWCLIYVTLDHKNSHRGQFFEIEMLTSFESWINNISINVWFVRIDQY